MALDITKLQAAVARNSLAVATLVTTHTDPTLQAAIDALADTVTKDAVVAEQAVALPVTAAT